MKNDTATPLPQQRYDAKPPHHRVGLLTECDADAQRIRELCTPIYEITLISPQVTTEDLYSQLTRPLITALLVQGSPSALACTARLAKLQVDLPIIVLCELRPTGHATAYMMGADFAISQPPTPALLQALRVAYDQRRRAQRLLPAPGEGEAGDDLTLDVYERDTSSTPSASDVTWPLEPEEEEKDHVFRCDPFLMDLEAHRLLVAGEPVMLGPRSFALCAYLIQHPDRCCSREELLREVWGMDFDPSTNVVDVQVYAIRQALRKFGLAAAIHTVRGVGYKFVWPPPPETQ